MTEEILQLVVVGINYKTSTLTEREILQINRKEMSDALLYFMRRENVEGVLIISTCNRLEFYFVLKENIDPFDIVNDYYINNKHINASQKRKLFYFHYQSDVAKHLFTIISGLDSMVLGEYQIQGQIKESYSIACSVKSADKILHKLFHSAFRIGKKVRSQTKIGTGKQSLSGAAFQLIDEKLKKADVITIIGVNENTKIIVEKLKHAGYSNYFFVNRTFYKAEELALKFDGVAFNLDQIEEPLSRSECVFSCTGAPGIVITSEMLNKVYRSSKHPKLIIDMAVPRDIDTNSVTNKIEIFDLDSLRMYLEKQSKEIALDIPLAEKIISDETQIFDFWNESLNDDVIGPYVNKAEQIRLVLLDETKLRVTEDEYNILDKFSRSLLHRMKSIFNETVRTEGLKK